MDCVTIECAKCGGINISYKKELTYKVQRMKNAIDATFSCTCGHTWSGRKYNNLKYNNLDF